MPLISPIEDLLSQRAPQPDPTAPQAADTPTVLDTLAAAFRQTSSVTSLYERFANEHSLPGQEHFAHPAQPGYDPFPDAAGFADDMQALRRLVRAESPEEMQFLKNRIRQERTDQATLSRAGGWGLATTFATGATDPFVLASMVVPVAPEVAGLSRLGRVTTGVLAQAAIDTTAEAFLHTSQETRTLGDSLFNIGAGALLSGVLGTIATRVPKGELVAARARIQADIARSHGVEPPLVHAPEGADSAGAARVVNASLEDEGIAKGGEFLAKTIGRISPLTRSITSPLKTARQLAQRLVDVPYQLKKNLKGIATPTSLESQVKRLVNIGRHQTMKVLDESFLEYKQAGGALARKQFSEEVSTALTRADTSAVPQVAKAAAFARKTFEEDKAFLKQFGVEFGDQVLGAPSYFPRVYNFDRIIANRADFENRLRQWFAQNPKMKEVTAADGAVTHEAVQLEPAEIEDAVLKTVDHILGMPTTRADLNLRTKTGAMKSRALDVPDEVLAPYLERDFETVMGGYFRGMAPEIELRRAGFSSADMTPEIEAVNDEAHRLIAATDDNVKKEALRAAQQQAVNDLTLMRDRLMGNVGTRGGKNIALVRLGRIARAYNYVRLLGSQTLSSMSDYGRLVSRYGLARTATRTAQFLTNWHLNKLTREEAHRIGTALEYTLDTRGQMFGDIMDELPRTRFDQGLQWVSNQFSRVSLMSPWNATLKSLATLLEQDDMARALTRMNRFDKARLASAGIDEADFPALREMFAQHGEDIGGLTRARTGLWEDQRLARIVEDNIGKVADEVIVTRGLGDLPRFMDGETWKTLLQFRSFSMASVNRTMIPLAQGLAMGDARAAQGLASMLALGAASYYAKEYAAGRKPSTDPARIIGESLSWSGVLGYFPDLWDPIAAYAPVDAQGDNVLPRFSRFKSRSPMESLLGPTFGTGLDTVLGSIGGFVDGKLEQRDVERFRRLLPFQNLFYIRRLVNAIEGETGEALGAEGATHKTFEQRLTENVATK